VKRLHLIATLSGLVLLVVSSAASPQAITYSVDCAEHQTVSAAIERGDSRKPLLIRIKGACNEFVSIERDNVTLLGDPEVGATVEAPDSSSDVISISGDGVTLENLTLIGGNNGVRNNHAVRLIVRNCVIQDAATNGIRMWVGDLRLQGTTIQRAGANGLSINRGGTVAISDSYILDNNQSGIYVQQNAAVSASNSTIRGNHASGVMLHSASHGDFGGNEISYNQENGLLIQVGSTANIDNNTIVGNQGDGVSGYLGTTLVLHGNQITQNLGSGVAGNAHATIQIGGAQINANSGDGIVMALGSKLILEEPATEVSNNGNYGLWCGDDESSVNEPGLLNSWGNPAGDIECTGF